MMWDDVRGLAQVQVDNIGCLSFVHWSHQSIVESQQIGQAQSALDEAILVVLDHLIVSHVP